MQSLLWNSGVLFTISSGQGENKLCSPLALWRGSKQSIPSNVIHSFPAAQPVGPLETAKSLGFSQTPCKPTPPW